MKDGVSTLRVIARSAEIFSATWPSSADDRGDDGDRPHCRRTDPPGSPSDFSANLRAPILVADGRGHQVINEASDAPVRAPLFAGDAVEAAA